MEEIIHTTKESKDSSRRWTGGEYDYGHGAVVDDAGQVVLRWEWTSADAEYCLAGNGFTRCDESCICHYLVAERYKFFMEAPTSLPQKAYWPGDTCPACGVNPQSGPQGPLNEKEEMEEKLIIRKNRTGNLCVRINPHHSEWAEKLTWEKALQVSWEVIPESEKGIHFFDINLHIKLIWDMGLSPNIHHGFINEGEGFVEFFDGPVESGPLNEEIPEEFRTIEFEYIT